MFTINLGGLRSAHRSRFLLLLSGTIAAVGIAALGLAFLTSTSLASSPAISGRQIFLGEQPLKNGGPACISCHNVGGIGGAGGGTMAKDLTATYSKFGEAALVPVLKAAPFPIMRDIYKTKPLTEDEISALVAFFKEVDTTKGFLTGPQPKVFFVSGAAAFLIILGIFGFIWRGRLSGVRQPLVKGGSK